MEKGYVCGKAPLLWTPKKNKMTVYCGKQDVLLRGKMLDDSLSACICKDCHKIVVDY
jgi:hypothetical protein